MKFIQLFYLFLNNLRNSIVGLFVLSILTALVSSNICSQPLNISEKFCTSGSEIAYTQDQSAPDHIMDVVPQNFSQFVRISNIVESEEEDSSGEENSFEPDETSNLSRELSELDIVKHNAQKQINCALFVLYHSWKNFC